MIFFLVLQFKLKAGLVIYLSGLADFIWTKSGTQGMPKNLDRPGTAEGEEEQQVQIKHKKVITSTLA